MSQYSYPGIAAATGTRVDSAAKHTMACRMNEALMSCWCENQTASRSHLHTYKYKYCIHKNDLVLNVGQSLNSAGTIIKSSKAYPSVVSNLGDMTQCGKRALLWLYLVGNTASNFINNKSKLREWCQNPNNCLLLKNENACDQDRAMRELKDMPYFTAQGFALGMAYASNLSGDTVGTVFIGGMVTVMNGAFELQAGDIVQWYFDFEENMFYTEVLEDNLSQNIIVSGTRKLTTDQTSNIAELLAKIEHKHKTAPSISDANRRAYNENQNGAMNAFPMGGASERKKNIAYPKPFRVNENNEEHYADKIRIFAKCVNGARPFEHVDLMLMTQTL